MIGYKVVLKLDKPIPMTNDGMHRKRYDEQVQEQIEKGISDFNEAHIRKSVVFIFCDNRNTLWLGVIIDEQISIDEVMADILRRTKLKGSCTTQEVVISTIERYSHDAYRTRFDYESAFVAEFFLNRADEILEKIAQPCTLAALKKRAGFGLYDKDLLSELERIVQPRAQDGANGHPVHYILRVSSKKICSDLVSVLFKNGRLRSARYSIIDGDEDFKKNYASYYGIAKDCTVVVDVNEIAEQYGNYSTSSILSKSLFDLIKMHSRDVLTVFLIPPELDKIAEQVKNSLPELTFVEINERPVSNGDAKKVLRAYCRKDKVKADKELLSMVAKDTGYNAANLRKMYDTWYANALKTKVYPQYADFKKNLESEKDKLPQGSAYEKLKEMIGLEKVKQVIDQAVTYSKVQKLLADRGMPNARRAMHMVFTGNPGTAKTTVARLFAQILKDNEVLSVGDLIECGRSDLVGRFVGWTAVQVKEMFKKAKGSVLFIDEAYSLLDDRSGSFGDEAINTIVQEMENCREDMVVIFAGYPKQMNEFISRNPGLRSRISFYVDFDNYSPDELFDITKLIAKNNGFKLADDAYETLAPIFENAFGTEDFGNGRFARNLVEQAQLAQSVRLSTLDFDSLSGDDLITLCAQDFSQINTGIRLEENRKQRIGFSKVV